MSVLTPNMSLIQSTIGTDTGLSWEQNLNASLNVLDGHNHAPGSGLPINPSGLFINSSLAFNSNAALGLAYVNLSAQGSGVPTPINLSAYSSGGELFYQDGSGNAVQITKVGSVNATSSGISSGTATASFVSSVLVATQSVGVAAAIDAATYILRYNGSYPTPSGNYISLQAPSGLATGYAFTFPATTPGSSGAFLTSDTSGNLSYSHVDGSTLLISGSTLSLGTVQTANLAALSVTPPKLAALNYQKSGNVNTTTATGLVYSGLSVTITTTGRPVMVMMQAANSAALIGALAGDPGNFAIFRQDLGTYLSIYQVGGTAPPGSVAYLDVVAAGTYTYKIYYGTGGAGTFCTIQQCALLAYEVA